MRRAINLLIAFLALAFILEAVTSCSRYGKVKGQSTEFATFIKAYTGGIISDKSTIRVELASDIPEATPGGDIKDGILTFSPPVKESIQKERLESSLNGSPADGVMSTMKRMLS